MSPWITPPRRLRFIFTSDSNFHLLLKVFLLRLRREIMIAVQIFNKSGDVILKQDYLFFLKRHQQQQDFSVRDENTLFLRQIIDFFTSIHFRFLPLS